MNCIQDAQSTDYIVKKSRFIGFAAPCSSEIEVMNVLRTIHTEHNHANHLAFAYKVIENDQIITRFNDAGEPKGTAGKPILAHLEGKNMVNVAIAVIRYFGGIKLGAGGLVRAYGTTAKNVLELCTIHPYQAMTTVKLQIDYKRMDEIQRELPKLGGNIISQDFGATVSLVIELPEKNSNELMARFN